MTIVNKHLNVLVLSELRWMFFWLSYQLVSKLLVIAFFAPYLTSRSLCMIPRFCTLASIIAYIGFVHDKSPVPWEINTMYFCAFVHFGRKWRIVRRCRQAVHVSTCIYCTNYLSLRIYRFAMTTMYYYWTSRNCPDASFSWFRCFHCTWHCSTLSSYPNIICQSCLCN